MRLGLMASEGGGEHGNSFPEYIGHHLKNLTNKPQEGPFDLSVIHLDTVFFSLLSAFVVLFILRRAAKKATPGVPGKFQAAVEMLIEFVNNEAKSMVHGTSSYIAPLALTVFCWVAFMNAIDLIPVDWLPLVGKWLGYDHLRALPTADLNATVGMAIGALILSLFYTFKIKGSKEFAHEMGAGHFPLPKFKLFNPLTWVAVLFLLVANIFFGLEALIAPTISHGFRIYGNMYAGELVFFLINGLNGTGSIFLGLLGLLLGLGWAIFHILIVLLQAYVFMMLTLVYIGRAYQHH
jgi:F-type H+-transporting ATPase subunit a